MNKKSLSFRNWTWCSRNIRKRHKREGR